MKFMVSFMDRPGMEEKIRETLGNPEYFPKLALHHIARREWVHGDKQLSELIACCEGSVVQYLKLLTALKTYVRLGWCEKKTVIQIKD